MKTEHSPNSDNKTTLEADSFHTPVSFLRSIFLERQEKNRMYSMRAFARDMGISQTLLSFILSGKRSITLKQATYLAIMLEMSPSNTQKFIDLVILNSKSNRKILSKIKTARKNLSDSNAGPLFRNLDIEKFKTVSMWYHVAILDLATTSDFKPDPKWISSRLGISIAEVKDAIDRLLLLGLLEKKNGTLSKAEERINFNTTNSQKAVRSFHHQMLNKAIDQLKNEDQHSFDNRSICSITLAISTSKLALAKRKIDSFQQEMADLMCCKDSDEVYQLNLQFFPLTNRKK